jgi:hypothetical protein
MAPAMGPLSQCPSPSLVGQNSLCHTRRCTRNDKQTYLSTGFWVILPR